MKIIPNSTTNIRVFNKCLSNSRDLNLYVVYYTTTEGGIVGYVWDKSSIMSFEFVDTVCGDSNMAYGGIGAKNFNFKFFASDTKPNLTNSKNRLHRFDVYYTPNDSAVQGAISSAGSAEAYFQTVLGVSDPSNYLIDLGTFFMENYRFRNKIGEVETVDCLGFLRSSNFVYSGSAVTPTVQSVVASIASSANLEWVYSTTHGTQIRMCNGLNLVLQNPSDWNGSSCYDVLSEIAKASGGFVKAVPASTSLGLAFGIVYPGGSVEGASKPYTPDYQTRFEYDNVFSLKNANDPAQINGIKYNGTGETFGSESYAEIDQNELWDGTIWQNKTVADQQAEAQTLLGVANAWPIYWPAVTYPLKATVTACPAYETLDMPHVALDGSGANFALCIITSLRMNNLGQMDITYAGQIDAQQNYITGSKTQSAIRKNSQALSGVNSAIYYRDGDVFNSAIYGTGGFLTSNLGNLYVYITLPKSMANIDTITVAALNGRMLSGNGAIDGSTGAGFNWLASAYTVTASKMSDYVVRLLISKASSMTNAAAQLAVNFAIGTIRLEFSKSS